MEITVETAKRLVQEQFPQWKELPVRPVAKSGHDNRTFHLGEDMTVRLPSGESYAAQVAKENTWLPYLAAHLDYAISKPLAEGKPTEYYPFPWSVNQWIAGNTLFECPELEKKQLARDLAKALRELQTVDCQGGSKAGQHNFFRGGDLKVYQQDTLNSLEELKDCLPVGKLRAIWDECVAVEYGGEDVWVHGDIAPGNILVQDGRFSGLIDFGILGTGDPACDYAMAWTYFDEEARAIFLEDLSADMVNRARGWALWKALLTYHDSNIDFKVNAHHTVDVILNEQ